MITQKFANEIMYSDVEPYEVVRVISEKTIEIRPMKTTKLPWDMDFRKGGFCGTVVNQSDQKWEITSDKTAPTFRIRLNRDKVEYNHETKKYEPAYTWKSAMGNRFVLADEPRKFYDYNF